jgi:hypothetical protein
VSNPIVIIFSNKICLILKKNPTEQHKDGLLQNQKRYLVHTHASMISSASFHCRTRCILVSNLSMVIRKDLKVKVEES